MSVRDVLMKISLYSLLQVLSLANDLHHNYILLYYVGP